MERALRGVEIPDDAVIVDEADPLGEPGDGKEKEEQASVATDVHAPPSSTNETAPSRTLTPSVSASASASAFELTMRVSSGTYVRSLVHDIGHEVGSAAFVVTLTRVRQGRFCLEPPPSVSVVNTNTDTDTHAISISNEKGEKGDRLCIPWDVFSKALEQGSADVRDEDGWRAWERLMIDRMEIVDANTKDN